MALPLAEEGHSSLSRQWNGFPQSELAISYGTKPTDPSLGWRLATGMKEEPTKPSCSTCACSTELLFTHVRILYTYVDLQLS